MRNRPDFDLFEPIDVVDLTIQALAESMKIGNIPISSGV